MNCLRLGVSVSAGFYMLVLWLGASSFHYFVWLGMVQGISVGLFWIAFNVVYFEVTDPDNRDRFNGWVGLLGSGAGISCTMDLRFTYCEFGRWCWISVNLFHLIRHLFARRGYQFLFEKTEIARYLRMVVSFSLFKASLKHPGSAFA